MPVQKRTLKVLPNPWLYIDHKGRPAARVAVEQPTNGTYDPRTVGSRITAAELVSAARKDVPLAQDVHDLEIEHDDEPVEVRNSSYYRRRVMGGELIAADRESFVAAGGRPKDFEGYREHIEAKKREAVAQFDLENGEGAFALLAEHRAEDAKARAAVAAAIAGVNQVADAVERGVTDAAPAVAAVIKPKSEKGGAQ